MLAENTPLMGGSSVEQSVRYALANQPDYIMEYHAAYILGGWHTTMLRVSSRVRNPICDGSCIAGWNCPHEAFRYKAENRSDA